MRVRTIEQLFDEVRRIDPETALTKTAIRRLVVAGEIPSRRAGTKYLVDLDTLEAYMKGDLKPPVPAPGCGEIRPVR